VRRAPTQVAPIVLFFSQTLVDVFAIGGAFVLAYWLRFESDIFRKFVTPDRQTYITMLGVTVATILATFYFSKLYNIRRGASRVDEFYKIAGAVSMGTVLSLATNSLILGDRFVYSRQILLMGWFLTIVFVTVGRMLHGAVVGQLRRRGLDRARVLIVGSGPTAVMVIDRLRYHETLGYQIVGVVDANGGQMESLLGTRPVPVLGQFDHLLEIVHRYSVDEVLVALTGASDSDLRDLIGLLQDESVSIKVYPDAFQLMTENEVSVGELSGLPLLSVKDVALRGWNRVLKRAFDVVFSVVVLTLTAPIMLLVALAVKLASPGPVFFIQERVGLDNIPFQLVKFRTMRVEGDERGHRAGEPGWTVRNDPRRTRTGTWLRRFSLDELPQFYNVLVGEMSVVGPRPEQPHYVQEFAQRIPQYLRRHREKAGITGWAQVNGLRGDTSIEMRTAADLYYVENWSILFDLKIIARTIVSMMRGKNAY
jgi:Undecaprenyl-phosphate glucose phosphotransferase